MNQLLTNSEVLKSNVVHTCSVVIGNVGSGRHVFAEVTNREDRGHRAAISILTDTEAESCGEDIDRETEKSVL